MKSHCVVQAGMAANQKLEKEKAAEGDPEIQPFLDDKAEADGKSSAPQLNGSNGSAAVHRHASDDV